MAGEKLAAQLGTGRVVTRIGEEGGAVLSNHVQLVLTDRSDLSSGGNSVLSHRRPGGSQISAPSLPFVARVWGGVACRPHSSRLISPRAHLSTRDSGQSKRLRDADVGNLSTVARPLTAGGLQRLSVHRQNRELGAPRNGTIRYFCAPRRARHHGIFITLASGFQPVLLNRISRSCLMGA